MGLGLVLLCNMHTIPEVSKKPIDYNVEILIMQFLLLATRWGYGDADLFPLKLPETQNTVESVVCKQVLDTVFARGKLHFPAAPAAAEEWEEPRSQGLQGTEKSQEPRKRILEESATWERKEWMCSGEPLLSATVLPGEAEGQSCLYIPCCIHPCRAVTGDRVERGLCWGYHHRIERHPAQH